MSMFETTLATAATTAADVANYSAQDPNWVLIIFIVGIFVIFGYLFFKTSKPEALEDKSENTSQKELPTENLKEEIKADAIDKEKLSLAEIKEAKRQSVSEDKSKEEMRKLRQERRADTQTQNAIHNREEAEKHKAETETEDNSETPKDEKDLEIAKSEVKTDDTDKNSEDQTVATDTETDNDKDSEVADKKDDSKEEETSVGGLFDSAQASESEDIFAAFFDNNDFEDDSVASDDAIIPTLGSALIPLEAMRAAAEASEEGDFGLFDGLLSNDASEKKTLV